MLSNLVLCNYPQVLLICFQFTIAYLQIYKGNIIFPLEVSCAKTIGFFLRLLPGSYKARILVTLAI